MLVDRFYRGCRRPGEREVFSDNLLVLIHFIIVMIRWTGLSTGTHPPHSQANAYHFDFIRAKLVLTGNTGVPRP